MLSGLDTIFRHLLQKCYGFGGLQENACCGGRGDWAGIFSYLRGGVLSSSANEAVEEDEQYGGADGDVELVSLEGESDDAEDDAEDWRGDEEEESELDDAGGVEVRDGVEES